VVGGEPAASTGCSPESTFIASYAQPGPVGGGGRSINVDPHLGRATWHCATLSLPCRGTTLTDGVSYNSQLSLGPNGYQCGTAPWATWWTQRLFPGVAGTIQRFDGRDMRLDTWTDRGDGLFTSPEIPGALRIEPDGSMTIRMQGGKNWHYKPFTDPTAPGALASMSDPEGNTIELAYQASGDGGGRLVSIADTYGAVALNYQYLPNGLLERITDLTGREVVLSYDLDQRLAGLRSPVGAEFPLGRRKTFTYVGATSLLSGVIFPNEVEAGLNVPRVGFVYGPTGLVTHQTIGGTNASGIAAGGVIAFERDQRPGTLTPFTRITNRRGFVTEQDYDPAARCVVSTVFTNGIRTNGPYATSYGYSAQGYLAAVLRPEGNSVVVTYRQSPNPYQIGEAIEVRRFAGPRGGNQAEIAVRMEYEALFNQVSRVEDPRFVDPGFVPPLGSKSHLFTRTVYEYQEGSGIPAREAGWGINASELVLNEPDRNGNGFGASGFSTVQSVFHPSTTLPGGSVQTRISLYGYNQRAQLVFAQNPGGVRTEYQYHPEADVDGSGAYPIPGGDPVAFGFLRSVTRDTVGSIYGSPLPITTQVTHNRTGDVVRTVSGRGIATVFVPNEVHLVREVIAADDTSEQPGQRNETEAAPALSIRTVFTRDANDNVVKVEADNRDNDTSHAGAFIERRMTYDILDRPLSTIREVTDADTVESTLRYDPNENLISTDDNQVPHTHTRTTYDERDLVFESFRGQGAEEARYQTEVDRNGNVTEVISPVDRVKQAGGAADGQLDRVRRAYDGHDRERQVIDALGNFTNVEFDPASQVILSETYGHPPGDTAAAQILLSASAVVHDEGGRVAQTKALLAVDDATAGALARPAELDTDDPNEASLVVLTVLHDANDQRTALRMANREKGVEETAFVLDGHRRVVRQTDAEGNVAEPSYDNDHQLVGLVETDVQPEGEIASQTFASALVRDALGRVTKSRDPKSAVRRLTWGTLFMTRTNDALDNISRVRRDGLGRVIRTRRELTTTGVGGSPLDTSNPNNPDGLITTLSEYDDALNQIRLVDDLGNTTRSDHDSRGNVDTTTYADGTTVRTTFDLGDAATDVIDQAGNVFTNTIDPLGRLVQLDIARAAGFVGTTRIVREFDGRSLLTRAHDNGGEGALGFASELLCRYDSLGNMLEEVTNGRVVSRTFKSGADPVSLTYPDGTRIGYETDRLSRLTELDEDGESMASWRYVGQRTHRRAWGNGTTTRYTHDNNRRLTRIQHERGAETLFDFEVGYNAEDFLTHEIRHHDGGTGLQVDLDSAYRVKQYRDGVTNPAGAPGAGSIREETFTLDGLGNWNAYSESLDGGSPASVTTAINEMNEYTQFGAAPQTHNDNGDRTLDDRHTYEWDALGRLRVVKDKTTSEVIARYSCHADGRRTRKELGPGNGNRTLFVWDGAQMIEESRPNGLVRARTVWGRESELVKREKGGLELFYHRDGKGWIAGITKKNGAVKEQYRYARTGR